MTDRPVPARKRARARTRRAARLFAAAAFLPALAAASLTACAGEGVDRPATGIGRALAASLDPDAGDGPPIEGGSPSGSYLAGRFALDAGEYGQAAEGFDRALAADPGNRELRRQVFLLRLAGGDTDRALGAATALVEVDAEADEALLLLALDRARAGAYAGARELLGRVGERGALGIVLPVLDAWAAFGAGEVDVALGRLGGGGEGTGQGLDLLRLYHRALMLDLAGRPAEALALLTGRPAREAGDGTDPLRIVQILAHLHLRLGDPAAAGRVVADALRANPDDPQLEALRGAAAGGAAAGLVPVADARDAMADALIGVAEALLDQQAGAQALLLARAAGFVSPGLADAKLLVGRILLAQGSPGEALRALEAIPEDAPQSWAARLLRAQALREVDRADEAVRLLRVMAAERPARVDALVAVGDLHRRDERYPEAATAYGEAVARLGGRLPGGEQWRLFYAQGMALERTKRWPEAQAALERALELQPEQPLVLNYLGYSWVDRGENLDRGKEMLHRAVELRPEDGFVVDSLGWAYHRVGEFEKAVTYLERAVELEPADPVINDHLGDAYWRVGRVREARFQWQRALSFKPEPDVAGQIQGKLERGLPAEAAGPTRG